MYKLKVTEKSWKQGGNLLQARVHKVVIPGNVHTGNITWTEQVIFRNCIYMYIYL